MDVPFVNYNLRVYLFQNLFFKPEEIVELFRKKKYLPKKKKLEVDGVVQLVERTGKFAEVHEFQELVKFTS